MSVQNDREPVSFLTELLRFIQRFERRLESSLLFSLQNKGVYGHTYIYIYIKLKLTLCHKTFIGRYALIYYLFLEKGVFGLPMCIVGFVVTASGSCFLYLAWLSGIESLSWKWALTLRAQNYKQCSAVGLLCCLHKWIIIKSKAPTTHFYYISVIKIQYTYSTHLLVLYDRM